MGEGRCTQFLHFDIDPGFYIIHVLGGAAAHEPAL